jgi:hypothetical protein
MPFAYRIENNDQDEVVADTVMDSPDSPVPLACNARTTQNSNILFFVLHPESEATLIFVETSLTTWLYC